ncbi:uncharacterized protein LOC117322376 [Pecten maximus]|uniref:uncharacterized protein LOC117322376 n=1 Tax=Pecten maximus TaxID=6579 RepID=UPI0014581FA4|nr:uncharacterized protein LOC117322376 [Pecten maximus]
MAEGGPRPDLPSVVDTRPSQSDSYLLECPICPEQLRQPKYLPCLHTFCEECLSIYIVKETSKSNGTAASFTCPVCRKLTHPVDKSEDKTNWAKQFPTDRHAVERIKLANKKTEQYYCKPCQKKGNTTSAQFWCEYNKTFFCKQCKEEHHDMVHSDCDIVNMTEFNRFQIRQENSTTRCDKHNEKSDCYCQNHKCFGCSKCIYVDHRRCEDVSTIEEYCHGLENTSRLDQRLRYLQQGADTMETLIKNFFLQLQSVTVDKDAVLKSIDELQERINKCVEQIKKKVTEDLISEFKKEQENFKVSSQKCERLMTVLQGTLASSVTAAQNNDHRATILLYQRGQAELESCRDLVVEIMKSFSTTMFEHDFKFDVSAMCAALSLGKVVVRKQHRNVPGCLDAFLRPFPTREIKQIRKTYIRCPSDSSPCFVVGLVCLPDGRVVAGDYNNKKIKLIDPEGNVVDEIKGSINDLCTVDYTTVAAAVRNPGKIRVVTVTSSKLTIISEINTTTICYGIAYKDGGFVVSLGSEVCSVSEDGTTHKLQKYRDNVYGLAQDSQRGHLFLTHNTTIDGRVAVSRLSHDNRHTDIMKVGVVKSAAGVDVDVEGNVYVCDYDSNNVVQMSADGKNIRELLTEDDGIIQPRAISVCEDKLAVSNGSEEQRDYIYVFQLV